MNNTNGQIDNNQLILDIIEQSKEYANQYRIPRRPIAEKVQQEVSQLLAIGNFNVNDYSNQISDILNNLEDGPQIEQKRHQIKFKTNSFSFGKKDTNQTHDNKDDNKDDDDEEEEEDDDDDEGLSNDEDNENSDEDEENHANNEMGGTGDTSSEDLPENNEEDSSEEHGSADDLSLETLDFEDEDLFDDEDELNDEDDGEDEDIHNELDEKFDEAIEEGKEEIEEEIDENNVKNAPLDDEGDTLDDEGGDGLDDEEHTKTFSLKNVITTLSLVLALVLGCKYGPQLWKFYKSKTAVPIEGITKSSHEINYRQVNTDYYEDEELWEDCNHDMFFSWKKLRPHQLKILQEKGITNIYLRYEVTDIPYQEFKPFKLYFIYSNFTNVQFIKNFKQHNFYQHYTQGFAATTAYLTALFNNKNIDDITIYINSQKQFNTLLPYLLKTNKRVHIFCQKRIEVTQTFNTHIYIYFPQ